MRLGVPRAGTALAAALVAAAVGLYLGLPAVRAAVDGALGALSTPDAPRAIEAVRRYVLGFGVWAPLASAALMVLQALVAPLPAFVITFANGLLFGWAWGAALSWASAMVAASLCFGLARALGRPAVERLLGGAAVLEATDRFFVRHGRQAIFLSRLLPFVPLDPVSYAAGLTSTRLRAFLLATGLGLLPVTLVYSYLGERFTGSVRVVFWTFSLVVAVAVIAWVVRRRREDRVRERGR